ncbi:MAG: hypothetical protein WD013_00875, partial [Gemmatimonadota bacterium]
MIERQAVRIMCAALLMVGSTGCGLLFPGVSNPDSPRDPGSTRGLDTDPVVESQLPTGLGTLRQDDISITLRRGDLQIRVTPLEESITRLTAPDTYERLSALERGHQDIFRETTGSAVPFQLFLVSLFSESTEVAFEP